MVRKRTPVGIGRAARGWPPTLLSTAETQEKPGQASPEGSPTGLIVRSYMDRRPSLDFEA
jgi:hypothetical protein